MTNLNFAHIGLGKMADISDSEKLRGRQRERKVRLLGQIPLQLIASGSLSPSDLLAEYSTGLHLFAS